MRHLEKLAWGTAAFGVVLALSPAQGIAPAAAAEFYKGKQFTLYIGSSPGGGYNRYARTIGRHLSKHIPGNPNIVFINMPGAGSRKLTAWYAKVAPKDGLSMAAIFPGAVLEPLFGKAGKYDPLKFNYIGSANAITLTCVTTVKSGFTTFDDIIKRRIVMGATQRGSPIHDFTAILFNLAGAKIKLVKGYKGSREITHAVETGEIQGICGYGYSSLMSAKSYWIKDGIAKIVLQAALKPNATLDKMGVPTVWDYIKKPADRELVEQFMAQMVFGRPYIMNPGAPARHVATIRAAFDATMKDKAFLAEAKKVRLAIAPASGAEVQRLVTKMYTMPKSQLAALKKVMNM